ncbi:Leucine Rich repeats (2 copies) [Lignipirellula cremea]|uniref:Leucine Rich repeats (2 copies) n=2 Tax=Lignipirellula cremea TaxID=2528010 RepID=A0A518DM14_9BACT|nr:Leucine Rich repeats (2 copies) [Lignipirellula cremea]
MLPCRRLLLLFVALSACFLIGCGGKQSEHPHRNGGDEDKSEARPSDVEPAEEIQKPWIDGGAAAGWQGLDDFGRLVFRKNSKLVKYEFPAFEVTRNASDLLATAPPPGKPFGLDLSKAKLSDSDLDLLLRFPHLKSLRLPASMGDEAIATVARLEELEHLDLSGTSVTSLGLGKLGQLQELKSLMLADTGTTDDGVAALGSPAALRLLDLARTMVSDQGVKTLASIDTLGSLDLSGCAVTDEGVKAIQDLHDLEILNLSRTSVADDGIVALSSLKRLQWLKVYRTSVTTSGVERLAGKLSNHCRIDH